MYLNWVRCEKFEQRCQKMYENIKRSRLSTWLINYSSDVSKGRVQTSMATIVTSGMTNPLQKLEILQSLPWFQTLALFFLRNSYLSKNDDSIIQLFHPCLGNSQNCCSKVLWTAQCTIAWGRKAEGNGASRCPWHRGAVVLSIPANSHEITVLLPNQCWNSQCFHQEMLS